MSGRASFQTAVHFLDSIDIDAPGLNIRNYNCAICEEAAASPPAAPPAATDPAGAMGLKDAVEQSFIDNSGVVSFTTDVSVALREATLISCQLAGRVASKLYPDEKAKDY